MSLEPVAVEPIDPGSEPAQRILRGYFDELVGRYHGRQATEEEIDSALRDDLAPPGGVLLVARQRLDTRSDLVEALRLYTRIGYEQTAPFNDGPHADRWLRKRLA